MHLYRDAVKQECEHIILVSSDSDFEPPLQFLKQDFPGLELGLILPRKQPVGQRYRPSNTSLSRQTDWTRSYVLESELKQFQFPDKVPTRKKPAIKPDYW